MGDRWDGGTVSYRLADRNPREQLTGDNLEEAQDRWGDRYHFRDGGLARRDLDFSLSPKSSPTRGEEVIIHLSGCRLPPARTVSAPI
jgi:hypothetical protein